MELPTDFLSLGRGSVILCLDVFESYTSLNQ